MRIQFNWSCQGSNRSCVQGSTSAKCCSLPARHSNHWKPHFEPSSCCAHSPTLNDSATMQVQPKGNLIRHKIKIFEPYNNPCFWAIWHYVSKKSHLYCIYITIIMCTATSVFTQYTFTQYRTCAIKNNLNNWNSNTCKTRRIFPCGKENVMMGRIKNTAGRWHRRRGGHAAADRLPVCWILGFNWA